MRILFLLLIASTTSLVAQSALPDLINTWETHKGLSSGSLWGAFTDEQLAAEKTYLKAFLSDLAEIPAAELPVADRTNHRLLTFLAEDELFRLEFGHHQFPLDSEGGFLAGIIYRTYGRRINHSDQLDDYLKGLRALPDYLRWQEEQMRAGMAAGRQSPRIVVDNCVAQIDRLLAEPVMETMFFNPVATDSDAAEALYPVVNNEVLPAYRRLRDFLAGDYRQSAPETVGVSAIDDGKRFYEQRVRYFTTYDVSPQEVFDTGQREVARIRQEMQTIIDDLGFDGSFADFLDFLRTDEQFYAKTPEDLLKEASWITKRMEAKLPDYFGRLPRMPLAVEPVPAALAPNYTGGRYSPGNYRTHRAGEFWVNTYDLPSRPLYVLPALALHEGAPGHHTQIMLAAELEGRPDFRASLYLSAYGEGWGLYAEYLGEEAGIYTTPYERFGRLTYEMWRACRLVVDPGMHYFGWDRDRAVAFLQENTALSLREVNSEIDRYIGWPGQAVSYKMGEIKIRELRRRAEAELGDAFDLRAFHDLILSEGAVTLEVLEEMVVAFIEESRPE